MADTNTPIGSTAPSEYEEEDFDVVNAERIEGVEDDEDTAEEDPQDVAYEDEMEACSACVFACPHGFCV
jgi:hypothetical protein